MNCETFVADSLVCLNDCVLLKLSRQPPTPFDGFFCSGAACCAGLTASFSFSTLSRWVSLLPFRSDSRFPLFDQQTHSWQSRKIGVAVRWRRNSAAAVGERSGKESEQDQTKMQKMPGMGHLPNLDAPGSPSSSFPPIPVSLSESVLTNLYQNKGL